MIEILNKFRLQIGVSLLASSCVVAWCGAVDLQEHINEQREKIKAIEARDKKIHRYEPSITDEKDVRLFVVNPPHEYASGKIVPRVQ